MHQIEYAEAEFLNVGQIVTWSWDLTEISPELSRGDIYEVTIYVVMSNGDWFEIVDLRYMYKFIRGVANSTSTVELVGDKTLEYYYTKSENYWHVAERNAKEAQ